jgi:hypothetical protein
LSGALKEFARDIDADDMGLDRIERQGEPGTDANIEQGPWTAGRGGGGERTSPGFEHLTEENIVDRGNPPVGEFHCGEAMLGSVGLRRFQPPLMQHLVGGIIAMPIERLLAA